MAKNNSGKKITIDKLAEIINKGFDGQMEYMGKKFDKIDGRFDKIDERFGKVEKDIKDIKSDLKDAIKRTDKLEMKMDYVENVLDIPAEKQ